MSAGDLVLLIVVLALVAYMGWMLFNTERI